MPVGVDNTRRLANFCSDQAQLLFGKAENVHLNMKSVVGSALGDDAPGQDIEILKALEHAATARGRYPRRSAGPQGRLL